MAKPVVHLLRLKNVSIHKQLQVEEALFRCDKRNWFIWNQDAPMVPTIVLGLSGKPARLVNEEAAKRDGIPLLKRFSGGGTVIVDKDTLFTTFIMNQDDVPQCRPYPRPIMDWSLHFYKPAFDAISSTNQMFALREDDYVFGDRKIGGNAQSISKDRWLHHTSFLWKFDPHNMKYLQQPKKQPNYRDQRDHTSFLQPIHCHIDSKEQLFDAFVHQLKVDYQVELADIKTILPLLDTNHRKSTTYLTNTD